MIQTSLLFIVRDLNHVILPGILTSLHLHIESTEFSTKTKSTMVSLPIKRPVTKHTTVKQVISSYFKLTRAKNKSLYAQESTGQDKLSF